MKTLSLICLIVMGTVAMAQPPHTLWTRIYGGDGNDYGSCVQITADGGFIIAGYTGSFGAGENDAWLIKTDSLGNEEWSNTYGGVLNDYAYSVLQDTADMGYVLLCTIGSDFPDSTNVVQLIKTDSNGDTLWTRTYAAEEGREVQKTNDGGYIIVGSAVSYSDVCLIKTNSSGDSLWSRIFTGPFWAIGTGVQQTHDGGYIVIAGASSATWLVKTDANGNLLWDQLFTWGSGGDWGGGADVAETADGGYIIACNRGGSLLWWSSGALIKTDSLGNEIWRDYGNCGYSVLQTQDGGYIMFGNTANFHGSDDTPWLLRTDAEGTILWSDTLEFVTPNYRSHGACIKQTSDGGYILTGNQGSPDAFLIRLGPEPPSTVPSQRQNELPQEYALLPVYPNPFNPITTISYYLPHSSEIRVDIYNLLGQRVETLFQGRQEGGAHSVKWDGSDFASGIYFVQLQSQNLTQTRKMLLIR
jgi:hypothetical protein